ncbi:Ig-like domain-containing protein [Luteirhabdus pelagi]|uniref:Ig-like domain-containing protein n=1 Tax=Luteirhabdus pelagi TaxID=2792783 RepID=UPI00193A10B7|nr:Ig-like domain-containing protein [Luteirhabdus pelagi]
MKFRFLYTIVGLLLVLSFGRCAKRGTPTGGIRDSIPPIIVRSNPDNYTTNFDAEEVRITFDEFIKLKNLQQNLIISPPMENSPEITPLTTSKSIRIRFLDTLRENTTYSINFGESIVDNNEENPFEYYKYVFSTGDYIDSLKLSGKVRDALLPNPEIPVTVMLYERNQAFNDSTIFNEKPTYITTTTDSLGSFELTNLKEGDYLLLALKEQNSDYIFQPKSDKIAFVEETVTLPTDSSYTLQLFKEIPDYKATTPRHLTKNHIVFGFENSQQATSLEVLSEVPDTFTAASYWDREKDTLHYWFTPEITKDSLVFLASNNEQTDTLVTRIRELFSDSLKIDALNAGLMVPKDTFRLQANTPITAIDNSKIQILVSDSIPVNTSSRIDNQYNIIEIAFRKEYEKQYNVTILPEAFTDFFGKSNDTLTYKIRTQAVSEYGTLTLNLTNTQSFPLLVQLVNSKFKVVAEKYREENTPILFENISPGNYYVRLIYDTNQNKRWDAGRFLSRTQPEKVVYYPTVLEIRANWSLNETFNLNEKRLGPVETATDPEE